MKTYPVFDKEGRRSPVFQIDNIYLGPATAARLLTSVEGVTNVRRRKVLARSSDVHVEFQYLGQPFIVWEPYGDNSRYWIGPADMTEGMETTAEAMSAHDIAKLEEAFGNYRPTLPRAILGDVLTLRFITRFIKQG